MPAKILISCLLLLAEYFALARVASADQYTVNSPDARLSVSINVADKISWSVALDGKPALVQATIAMEMGGGRVLGKSPTLESHTGDSLTRTITPQVPYKDAQISSACNQLTLRFTDRYQLIFRAYDEGVAYRWVDDDTESMNVVNEEMTLTFPDGTFSYFPQEESMYSHNERIYLTKTLPEIAPGEFCSLPVMFDTGTAKVLFTEAALHNYPCMFVAGSGENSVSGIFPKVVLKAIANKKDRPDRNQILVEEAPFIARTAGSRAYPWRAFMISADDRTFVESNLVTELSGDSKIPDATWIKPGKVAWDWYNANNIFHVDFEAGLNTATYKYYIDFAADNGIEYVILDEGWTKSTTDILEYNPEMDVPELIEYADSKDVGIILWVLWKPLDENLDEILDLYSRWGARGIKVDFMQRSDQYVVESYERIAEAAAARKLLVDYHGAFKPAGIERVWPNIINYEGVKGNENNKWSKSITPEHHVTIPFIRMAAGPIDFTPGSMVNAHPENFAVSFTRPMSMGTRCHQVAMYVVYEAPLQMLCESPTLYKREQETVDFITRIPTVWDETVVLEAAVADYLVVARRKGDRWYIGGMTDAMPREFTLDLSFLDSGTFTMDVMRDGVNADKYAEDYRRDRQDVDQSSQIAVKMVSGGGWAAILTPK